MWVRKWDIMCECEREGEREGEREKEKEQDSLSVYCPS